MGGGICYERTLFGLQRALENRVSKYQDKKKANGEAAVEAYSLVGFPYAFQVWAYEAIPLIGLKYATRVSESYPRILNWSATSAPRSTEVENVFLEPHLTFHSLLTPTLEEQQQDYYKHVDKQGASAEMLHQSNASQDAKKDDLRHEKSSSDTAAYVAAATAAMAEETTNDAVPINRGGVCNFRLRVSNEEHDDEVERNDIPMDVNIYMEASRNLQLAEKHMTKELKDDYSIDDPVIDIAKLFAPFYRSHQEKETKKRDEKPLTSFDPLRPISEEALESFQKWMSDNQGSTINIDYMHIDKKWFQSLSNHGSWLANTVHIDVAFFFFPEATNRKSSSFFPKVYHSGYYVWQNAQARWIKHGKKWNQFKLPENDILIDDANGLQPLYSVKWPDVNIVYVPINVRSSHWVLGVVHLHRRIIYVYDSLMDINNNARLQVAIKPLAKLLPHILNAIAYYGFHALTLIICVPCNGDCGMFVIKYVEYLMHNHPLKSLTSAGMDWFQEKMAAELFYMKYLPM
ncbi:hypothetical protein CK203_114817 [Vitis vinifera]|uniref:Ubiquitin-like protease family profile domain-containing protein n=1 Tax=Vitis vinifera TaxID=29760 RepID=A0A438FDN7_VITVI|nr:hypothetical protein CK203_114817 [Vitis vinifera]